jgi:pyruvate,orthophosphate dikinase
MQIRALLDAVADRLAAGGDPRPEILVPMVSTAAELRPVRRYVSGLVDDLRQLVGRDLSVPVGSMIELPLAALTAGEIAGVADFFSIGTNDLTQTTWGLSRDDAEGTMLAGYRQMGLITDSPFVTIDQRGVGHLVRTAVQEGRACRAGLPVGVCGEHAADPASIEFFHDLGIDYVSCAPPLVPTARYCAGRAAQLTRDRTAK